MEVMVATGILATAVVTLAQLFAVSTRMNLGARNVSYASILAEQKIEELRALTWGFDSEGLPVSDLQTNTAVDPEDTNGGTGLRPSPSDSLRENTIGYVDFIDAFGSKVGNGDPTPPGDAVYTRRWSIHPLPTNPNNTLIIQVLVTPVRERGQADQGTVARLPEEARIVTVKTRKAQ
ncbi:MAG: hypothetical protein AB7K63_09125 [Vicinamibacterales bacterium]